MKQRSGKGRATSKALNGGEGLISRGATAPADLPIESWDFYAHAEQLYAKGLHAELLAMLLFELSRELVQSDEHFSPQKYFMETARSDEFMNRFASVPNASPALFQEFSNALDLPRTRDQPICPPPWRMLPAARKELFLGYAQNGYFRLTTSKGVDLGVAPGIEASSISMFHLHQQITQSMGRLVGRTTPSHFDSLSDSRGLRKRLDLLDERPSSVPPYAVLEIFPGAFTDLTRKEVMDFLEGNLAPLWKLSKGGRNSVMSMLGDLAVFRLSIHYGADKASAMAQKAWGIASQNLKTGSGETPRKTNRDGWLIKILGREDWRKTVTRHLAAMRKLFPEHRYSTEITKKLPPGIQERFCRLTVPKVRPAPR